MLKIVKYIIIRRLGVKHWLKWSGYQKTSIDWSLLRRDPPFRGPINFIIIIKQTANLDGNQFSNFFIRYYLYRNLKVEGSLKWKWSLVSFTIKCYNSTKNCMLRLNNQIVRYTGKNPYKSVGAFLRGVNFIVHGWSAMNWALECKAD